jgi:rhodanese-related sulfurtransferase
MTPQQYIEESNNLNTVLLDIRRSDERLGNRYIEGSMHVPIEVLLGGEDLKLPTNTKIIVLCERGGRAEIVNNYLKTLGYTDVHTLEGGYAELHQVLER